MLRHLQNTVRTLALAGVATAALLAPHAASARPAVEGGQVLVKHAAIDLRSPDSVTPVQIQQPKVDLRSPDAALPVQTPTTSHPATVGTHADSNDFDFGDAAIGAGTALLVALAGAGSVLAVNRRRSTVSLGG